MKLTNNWQISFDPLESHSPDKNTLIIKKPRLSAALNLLVLIPLLWFIGQFLFPTGGPNLYTAAPVIAALITLIVALIFYALWHSFKITLFGEEYHFKRDKQLILKNGRDLATFPQINHIEIIIRTPRKDQGQIYMLSLMYLNGQEIRLTDSATHAEVMQIGQKIATFMNKSLIIDER